jgi:hypothetical protein
MKDFLYLGFTNVFGFLGLKPESTQTLSHASLPFLDLLAK